MRPTRVALAGLRVVHDSTARGRANAAPERECSGGLLDNPDNGGDNSSDAT